MLTQDEAELYDRQIRLWGVNAQSKLRQSRVLMLGFNGVASEVAKILVLAGIDTLTIVDDQPLQDNDLSSNLFCRPPTAGEEEPKPYRTHAVTAKLRTLNPLVKVNIDNSPLQSKSAADLKGYDLVTLHTILDIQEISSINKICRAEKIKFYLVFDYGFFGFIFNDPGKEFHFTYEDFTNASNQQVGNIEVGDEKDPISLGDEDVADNTSDDDQKDRPAKRRRYHSPGREPVTKTEVVDDKRTKIGKLYYTQFEDMLKTMKNSTYTKQTNPVLFISIAMLQFYSEFKHLPHHSDPKLKQEDLTNLNRIITSMRETLNLDDAIFKNLDPDWYENIYGSLSPVCAIVGGVAGQDMIRSLSNKDIPLNNTFSFDGITMNGGVHQIGAEVLVKQAKPVVRDIVEIDSD